MLSKNFLCQQRNKRIQKFSSFALIGALVLSLGCQYHLVNPSENPKIELSFKGDQVPPAFKDEVVLAIKRFTGYRVVNGGGQYVVEVDLGAMSRDNIGFLYDREPLSGALINRLFPNEGRLTMKAKISIVDKEPANRMIEHMSLSVSSDYDFTNPNTLHDTQYAGVLLVEYSLGQFDSEDGAYDIALPLVQKKLAQQVALFVGSACQRK
ncbi:MAG: hypothetical protein ACOYK9_00220 [Chlamydiia bacterium]